MGSERNTGGDGGGTETDSISVIETAFTVGLVLAGAFLLDGLVHPRRVAPFRPWRSIAGSWILVLLNLALFGGFLGLSGNPALAGVLTLALQLLFVCASNAKRRLLGEALLFSDLALIGGVFRHPQFYLSALKGWQKACAVLAAGALTAAFAWLFVPVAAPHIQGAVMCAIALSLLVLSLRLMPTRRMVATPGAEDAVIELGLLPSILVYWLRWRESADPPVLAAPGHRVSREVEPELIVAIQCESFADPADLFGDPAFKLMGLESARAAAGQSSGQRLRGVHHADRIRSAVRA